MLKRFGLTFLLTTLGAILGLAFTIAFVWDWFTSDWVQLEASPEHIAEFLHIERDQVWVESASGILYKYNDAENCQSDCWTTVQTLPSPVWHDDPELMEVRDETCSPARPLLGADKRIEQCRVEMWANRNYVFAQRDNGDLLFWQGQVYGEWLVVELFMGLCSGAICFSAPALLFILAPEILRRLFKKEKQAIRPVFLLLVRPRTPKIISFQ